MEVKQLQEICTQVRRDIVRMVHGVQSGHPGGSLGCTEFLVGLYFNRLRHRSPVFTMDGQGEDLFFLSNGHISPVFYSVLARSGYFEEAELGTFRKINSRLQGHPIWCTPCMEMESCKKVKYGRLSCLPLQIKWTI
jgi:transketolase